MLYEFQKVYLYIVILPLQRIRPFHHYKLHEKKYSRTRQLVILRKFLEISHSPIIWIFPGMYKSVREGLHWERSEAKRSEAGGEKAERNIKFNNKEMTGHIASEAIRGKAAREIGPFPFARIAGISLSLSLSSLGSIKTSLFGLHTYCCQQATSKLRLIRCDWLSEVRSPSFDFILNQFVQTKKGIATHSKVTEKSAFIVN